MNESDQSLFDLGFALLLQNIWLFLILVLTGGVVGVAVSYLLTPQFRAEATLVPSDEMLGVGQNSLLGGLSGIVSLVGGGGGSNKESEAIAVLKSRALTTAFIQKNNLLPIIFHERWDAAAHKWKTSRIPTLQDGFREFDKNIRTVVDNRKTELITLSITWEDPEVAKKWAEDLLADANEMLRQQAIERSATNLEYLESASAKTTIMGVRETLYKLMEAELKKQMLAYNKDYAFRVIDPAVAPDRKVSPKRSLYAAFGAVLGTMIWFVWAVLRRRGLVLKRSPELHRSDRSQVSASYSY